MKNPKKTNKAKKAEMIEKISRNSENTEKLKKNDDDFEVTTVETVNKKKKSLENSNIIEFAKVNEHIISSEGQDNADELSTDFEEFESIKQKKENLVAKKRIERQQNKITSKLNRKTYNKKYVLFVVGCVVVILLVFLVYSASKNSLTRNNRETTDIASFEVDTSGKYAYVPYNDGIIAANGEQISFYDSELNLQWSEPVVNGSPIADVSQNNALVCYNNTPDFYTIAGKHVNHLALSANVIGGDVNNNGSCAVIGYEEGYKSQIAVYDDKGSQIYKWHSAENYIMDVDLSDKGDSMIVATLDYTNGSSSGGLMFFNFSQEKPYAGFVLEDNVVVDVKYLSRSRIAAIGDKETIIYNKKGEVVNKINYNGMKLVTYDTCDNGNMLFCLSHDDSIMSSSDAVVYNDDGKEIGRYKANGNIKTVSLTRSRMLIVLDRELVLLTDSADIISKAPVNRDIRNAILLDNGKKAFVVSGTTAQLIKIN